MKTLKPLAFSLLILQTLVFPAWAGNKLINVQGKITDNTGKLLSGAITVTFRMYRNVNDPLGSAVWVESQGFNAVNGLFNVTLGSTTSLDTLPFNTPYYLGMQVAGDANELTPRQLLGASAYALGSLGDFNVKGNLVVNQNITVSSGAISLQGKDVASYLVPVGGIMMFDQNCPVGWTRFTDMDGYFPMGNANYGWTGGSATHSHTLSADGQHQHSGTSDEATLYGRIGVTAGSGPFNPNVYFMDDVGDSRLAKSGQRHTHPFTTNQAGNHNHGGVTGTSSTLPPFRNVVWCKKN